MEFYKSFLKFIERNYPSQFAAFGSTLPIQTLFSPAIVEVKKSDFVKIKKFIEVVFNITHSANYIHAIQNELPEIAKQPAPNYSAFMSYDFHMTLDGPKLIEINTNASLSSLACLLSEFQKDHLNEDYLGNNFFEACRKMFLEERIFLKSSASPRVAITDDNPTQQKAYTEFLFYQSLFTEWGWKCDIVNTQDLDLKLYDLIYNRNTDFYFETPSTKNLKSAFTSQEVCVTPNPREYGLLADKERLLYLNSREKLKGIGVDEFDIDLIASVIPMIAPISNYSLETAKKEREKLFFKPRRSFGGKAVYRGKTMSNRIFEEILSKDYLAQELIEPPVIAVETDTGTLDFKWDLRVYTYKDQPQLMIARLYQGQMTNTQTLGGGLAPVLITD